MFIASVAIFASARKMLGGSHDQATYSPGLVPSGSRVQMFGPLARAVVAFASTYRLRIETSRRQVLSTGGRLNFGLTMPMRFSNTHGLLLFKES